jgi:hypothetical protein
MRIITTIRFFTFVQKSEPNLLTVPARVAP